MPKTEAETRARTHAFEQSNGDVLVAGPPVTVIIGTHQLLVGFQALVTKHGTRYWLRVEGLSPTRSTVRLTRAHLEHYTREPYTFTYRGFTKQFPTSYFSAFLASVDAVPRPKR